MAKFKITAYSWCWNCGLGIMQANGKWFHINSGFRWCKPPLLFWREWEFAEPSGVVLSESPSTKEAGR